MDGLVNGVDVDFRVDIRSLPCQCGNEEGKECHRQEKWGYESCFGIQGFVHRVRGR